MVYGGFIPFQTDRLRRQPRLPSDDGRWQLHAGRSWMEMVCRKGINPIASPEAITRTRLQKEIGGYRQELPHSADMEMWLRFAVRADIGELLDADQAYYRIHTQNMHKRQFSSFYLDVKQRKAAFATFFRDNHDRLPYRASLEELVNRSVARDALWAACWAFDHGEAERGSVREIVEFANRTYTVRFPKPQYPRAYLGYLRAYVALHARILLGSRLWPLLRPVIAPIDLKEWYG